MSDPRQRTRDRVARERSRQSRHLARALGIMGVALMASTLFTWENHPSKELDPLYPNTYLVHEVAHTVGLLTMPAGVVTLALGAVVLLWARYLHRGARGAGLVALCISLGALGVCVGEFTQLLLGRRNWLGHFVVSIRLRSPLVNAVGVGVWVAAISSRTLLTISGIYLWHQEGMWRDAPDARRGGAAATR